MDVGMWQHVLLVAAYAVAICSVSAIDDRAGQSFALALGVGAFLAYVGAGWLAETGDSRFADVPQFTRASLLFVPIGPLLIAPWREAIAALALPFAIARLGCSIGGCCYTSPMGPLFESMVWIGIAWVTRRAPRFASLLVLGSLGVIRVASSPFRAEPDTSAVLLMALGWIPIGGFLVDRLPLVPLDSSRSA